MDNLGSSENYMQFHDDMNITSQAGNPAELNNFVAYTNNMPNMLPMCNYGGSAIAMDHIGIRAEEDNYEENLQETATLEHPNDWSIQELNILNQCLSRFAYLSGIRKYLKISEQLPQRTVLDVAVMCAHVQILNASTAANAPMASSTNTSSTAPIIQNLNSSQSQLSEEDQQLMRSMDHIDALMLTTEDNIMGILTPKKIENSFYMISSLGEKVTELENRFRNSHSVFNKIRAGMWNLPHFPISARIDLLRHALGLS